MRWLLINLLGFEGPPLEIKWWRWWELNKLCKLLTDFLRMNTNKYMRDSVII